MNTITFSIIAVGSVAVALTWEIFFTILPSYKRMRTEQIVVEKLKNWKTPYIENIQIIQILSLKQKLTPKTKIDLVNNVPTIVPKTKTDYALDVIEKLVKKWRN